MQCNSRSTDAQRGLEGGRTSEQGSALLIVFVFAAIVAIMLYKAVPGVVFEAQRQKEQLLIDRGNEYKRGIKLFYIHNHTYPTSLDQLDHFNNLRYIRHRFKDPMTDKKDWRLIHVMGPGFVLTDSKVTPPPMQNGQSGSGFGSASNQSGFGQSGNTSGFGQSSTGQSGFGQSGFGQSGNTSGFGQSSSSQSGFGNSSQSSFGQSGFGQTNAPAAASGESAALGPDGKPLPTAAEIYGAKRRPAPTADAYMGPQQNANNGQDAGLDQPLPLPGEPNSSQAGQNSPQNSPQNPGAAAQGNNGMSPNGPNGSANGGTNGGPNGQPASPALDAVNSALRRQGQMPTRSSTFGSSGFGVISAGAIAGVASTAQGSSIKKIDKQTDYSKWEFVYDPQKEAAAGIAQGMRTIQGQNGSNQTGQPAQAQSPNSSGPSSSGFGPSSGFGNSSGSSFGSSSGSSFGSSSGGANSSGSSSGFGNSGSSSSQQNPN